MNRRSFFQRIVGGAAAAMVAPRLTPAVRWKSKLWTGVYEPSRQHITWSSGYYVYVRGRDGQYIWADAVRRSA